MNKVELLAPAGNYESFIGAMNAGADAVYLGGTKFGARAFADNFSQEEICNAIGYAHLFEKKVYLAVNTLIKANEMNEMFDYIKPYYEVGLDGVIIQDIGVFQYLKRCFPKLELHVSTQMTITGVHGAKLLKEMGAARIVPARELSLEEIRTIKEEVDIELETFVHGAMCYCYSGQCLFSSILGGRSGNRGKCAQPCRLPYTSTSSGMEYPLSLKDLCTIEMIPQLLDAGIDSFKIEGRMKKPEYTAGVTSIYRKYIDLYDQQKKEGTERTFRIEKSDLNQLKQLYIRSELQDGYYQKHNGREMVTIDRPGYSKTDDTLCQKIRETFLEKQNKISVSLEIVCCVGTEMKCTVWNDKASVTVKGAIVEKALKAPTTEEMVQKQILKSGATHFAIKELHIVLEEDAFIPVKALNEIRRTALECLEAELTKTFHRNDAQNFPLQIAEKKSFSKVHQPKLTCEVMHLEQYFIADKSEKMERIYLFADCFLKKEIAEKIVLEKKTSLYLALPFVLRKRDQAYLEHLKKTMVLYHDAIDGVLFKNLEGYQWLKSWAYTGNLVADAGVYNWNEQTQLFWETQKVSITSPYELNVHELKQLKSKPKEMVVYGKIPLMITANCIRKTNGTCSNDGGHKTVSLIDRYRKKFEVYNNCEHCYNIIVNSLPLSLHHHIKQIKELNVTQMRLYFTGESTEEVTAVIQFFSALLVHDSNTPNPPYKEYTNGHFKRGVE